MFLSCLGKAWAPNFAVTGRVSAVVLFLEDVVVFALLLALLGAADRRMLDFLWVPFFRSANCGRSVFQPRPKPTFLRAIFWC